jgi:hypothetical protein
MRPKTLNPGLNLIKAEITTIKINPGPGQYEKIETINKIGK